MNGRGFTLTELLLVIMIVAVLATVLAPVVVIARERSAQSVCAGNEAQIAMALQQYVHDNDGYFPIGTVASRQYLESYRSRFQLLGEELGRLEKGVAAPIRAPRRRNERRLRGRPSCLAQDAESGCGVDSRCGRPGRQR